MKKSLLAFLAIGAVAYSGLWYYGSGKAKENVLKQWEEAARFADEQGYSLTYKNIFSEGFPTSYIVKIQDPLLSLKDPENSPDSILKRVYLDGTLHFGSNLLGSKFWVGHKGTGKLDFKGNKQNPSQELHLTSTGEDSSEIQILQQDGLQNLVNPFNKFVDEYLNPETSNLNVLVKNIRFSGKNIKLINDELPTLNLLEFDNLDVNVAIERTNQSITAIDLDIFGKGIEFLIGDANSYIPGPDRSLQDIALIMSIPNSKTDIELKLKLNAPFEKFGELNEKDSLASFPAFNFDLIKLKASDDFATHHLTSQAILTELENNGRKLHFDFKSQSSSNEAQAENLIKQWEKFLQNFPFCQEEPLHTHSTPGEVCLLIRSLIPNMHKFGNIVYHVDIDFETKNATEPTKDSKLFINKYDIVSDLYGITSRGEMDIHYPDGQMHYTIDILNYKLLLSDLFKFGKTIEKIAPYLNPELPKLDFLNDKTLATVTNFLESISDEPKSLKENISITFKIEGPTAITVGTLPIHDVIYKWEKMQEELKSEITNPLNVEAPEIPTDSKTKEAATESEAPFKEDLDQPKP